MWGNAIQVKQQKALRGARGQHTLASLWWAGTECADDWFHPVNPFPQRRANSERSVISSSRASAARVAPIEEISPPNRGGEGACMQASIR